MNVDKSDASRDPSRWQDISDNPDDARVVAWREIRVRTTAATSLPKYEDIISRYCTGLRVLDFGAANHTASTTSVAAGATHDIVARYASSVVAVDISPFHSPRHPNCTYLTANLLAVEEWSTAGIDPLEVIFAGHVIEHLDSPGELFELAQKALVSGGVLVVATPNPLWFLGLWARAHHENATVNPDHVALFGAGELMELGERHAFKMTEWRYAGLADMAPLFRPNVRFGRFVNWAYRYSRTRNLAFAHNTIMAVFERAT